MNKDEMESFFDTALDKTKACVVKVFANPDKATPHGTESYGSLRKDGRVTEGLGRYYFFSVLKISRGENIVVEFQPFIFRKPFLFLHPKFWWFDVSPPFHKKIRKHFFPQSHYRRAIDNRSFKKLGCSIS